MGTASLALLKGANKTVANELDKAPEKAAEDATPKGKVTVTKKTAPAEEAKTEEAPAAAEEQAAETTTEEAAEGDQITIAQLNAMSAKDIDALIKDNEIEVPEDWGKRKLDAKRAWLIEQFDDGTETATETAVEDATEQEQAAAEEEQTEAVAEEPPTNEELPEAKEEPAPEEQPAEKPAKKGKAGKAVAKSEAKSGEIVGPDALSDLVHEIENLTETQAREMVASLAEAAEETYFKLGAVLSVVQANGWFTPYASFREYIENEHGIVYRRAMYWVGIYNDLVESGIPFADVKHLGWTKLTVLASILTKENVKSWLKSVEGKTVIQITEMVKSAKAAEAQKQISGEQQTASTTTTMTFKVHEDQKEIIKAAIEKSKEISGTKVDTVALENICLDFMGGTTKSMKERFVKLGMEEVLEVFQQAFPNANLTVELTE